MIVLHSKFLQTWLVVLVCAYASVVYAVSEVREFDNETQRERYQHFAAELRCPNCQGQNIAGSNSDVAMDLRTELHRLIMEGKTDEEIIDFMRSRYGDYILYRPQFQSNTYALWLGPVIMLLLGFGVAAFILLKRKPIDGES